VRHADHLELGSDSVIRRLFTAASTLSLLLCVATAGLWVRSWRIYDTCAVGFATQTHWPSRGYMLEVESSGQRLRLTATSYFDHHDENWLDDRDDIPRWSFQASQSHDTQYPLELDHGDGSDLRRRGYASESQTMHGPRSIFEWTTLIVPHWFVIIATLPFPLLCASRIVRRRLLRRPGHCPSCGYDLRESKDRCPECGTVASTTIAPA
jgi:hypothetical protein